MILRVISDIHSNMEALLAVLEDPAGSGAELTVCLGDVVGYGSGPSACIRMVRDSCDIVIAGNHDSGVAGMTPLAHFNRAGAQAVRWTSALLSAEEKDWLTGLPLQEEVEDFHLCHSDPADPAGWSYIRTKTQATDAIGAHPGKVCLVGHTHLPGCWSAGGSFSEEGEGPMTAPCLINCGSVGQPRDGDPRAAYLLLDTEAGCWRHMRVPYDIQSAAEGIRRAGLPEILANRLSRGL